MEEQQMTSVSNHVTDHERLKLIQAFNHLKPGSYIDLQFNSENPLRVKSKLIGFDEGHYLIVTAPLNTLRDYADVICEGAGCIVRTIIEGEAGECIAFRSKVDVLPIRPKGLLVIAFPKQVESICLRKECRIKTQLSVTFVHRDESAAETLFDAKTEVSGHIQDISSGGCRVTANWPEQHKNIQHVPVYIKVIMADGSSKIVKAEIKNQHREDPVTISIGMMFVPDLQLKKLLNQLALH